MPRYLKPLEKFVDQIRQEPVQTLKDLARDAGNTYLKHRERIDPALIGHAVTTAALTAAAHKVAIGAITIKLAPLAVAAAGAYYGPDICRIARDFLAEKRTEREILLLAAPQRVARAKQESTHGQ